MGLVLTFCLAACSGGNSSASTEEGNASDVSAASASVSAQSSGEDALQSASVQAESEQSQAESAQPAAICLNWNRRLAGRYEVFFQCQPGRCAELDRQFEPVSSDGKERDSDPGI